jgi:hypothetical protein
MRYVISIDVGIKNLGFCVFDFVTAKFVFWDNISLVPNGRYIPSNNVQYVRDFITRYQSFFDEASCVIVERQMRCNMRIIESVVQALFFDTYLRALTKSHSSTVVTVRRGIFPKAFGRTTCHRLFT